MTSIGRQLGIGKTDNTSDQRTPRKRLRLIPTDVRESFVPVIPARAVQRQNEWDLTRIAPNRPRAEGSPIEVKGTVLKPNMIIPGSESKNKSSLKEIAEKTLDCLKKNVPSEVPGIAFLSGGQSEIESSKNLNEINKINDTNFLITFSYGRGLQASALKEFGKNQENIESIQKAFNHRAKMNGLSSKGEWSENLEKESAA